MGQALSKVVGQLCEGGLRAPFSLRYEEEGHLYWIDGISVPSVTQVVDQLQNWRGIDPEVLARAARRGQLIHKACELVVTAELDWTTVDESIRPEVEAFQDWFIESNFRPVLVEQIVGSKQFRFAGRLDLFGEWKSGLALIDWKSGNEYPAYRFQTAGLEIALKEMLVAAVPIQRYCLYLKGGKARPVRHEDPRDRSRFLAALTCSHTRRELYP